MSDKKERDIHDDCKNCIFSGKCKIPGFILCNLKNNAVKQNSDWCEHHEGLPY